MKIAVIPGDGIGPEIMAEAIKVLDALNLDIEYHHALIGGAAYDKFQNHFPDETKQIASECDAILFGSVGGPVDQMHEPKWKDCERNSILAIRKHFDFNANLRPVKVYPQLASRCVLRPDIVEQGIDIMTVRELSGGIYFGEHRTEGDKAWDIMEYDVPTIEAIAHAAFKTAQTRRKKVTSVDKANVLDCSRLWRKTVDEIAKQYPDIELEHILVDNCAMQIVQRPSSFDVLLMPNMFGDILSDLTSVLSGSIGMLPSASLNKQGFGMYEPSGGSAPDIAGKGIANPIAQILSAALMLKISFGLNDEHDAIVNAIQKTLDQGILTGDLTGENPVSTQQMGDAIIKNLNT